MNLDELISRICEGEPTSLQEIEQLRALARLGELAKAWQVIRDEMANFKQPTSRVYEYCELSHKMNVALDSVRAAARNLNP